MQEICDRINKLRENENLEEAARCDEASGGGEATVFDGCGREV